jgi:hypothetical protein
VTTRFKDETGKWHGKLRVLRFDQSRNGQAFWICKCWCGGEVSVRGANLRSGNTKSCGSCSRKKVRRGKMFLQTFGHVLVMGKSDRADPRTKWFFFCNWCSRPGEATERKIRNANAPLCECLKPTYYSWRKMIERCTSKNLPQFSDYRGRGIRVCQRWRESFSDFVTDMKPRPEGMTLDRWPNPAGNYESGNCRWATKKQQAQNRRKPKRR